jgi:transcriptional regulator GlxA family with amidase domain
MAGPLAITEIACQPGFEHPPPFSKFFKKKTNLSPQKYKYSVN